MVVHPPQLFSAPLCRAAWPPSSGDRAKGSPSLNTWLKLLQIFLNMAEAEGDEMCSSGDPASDNPKNKGGWSGLKGNTSLAIKRGSCSGMYS